MVLRTGLITVQVAYRHFHPRYALREVRRVLKPGGTFTAVLRTRNTLEKMNFTPFGFAKYEQADWENVLRANGFAPSATVVLNESKMQFEGTEFISESLVMIAVHGQ